MPNVTVSLPQDLLDRIDRHAREHGTTLSAILRGLAEREFSRDEGHLPSRVDELLRKAGRYGGDRSAPRARPTRPAWPRRSTRNEA